jgi:CheY-like chemotaxis protein
MPDQLILAGDEPRRPPWVEIAVPVTTVTAAIALALALRPVLGANADAPFLLAVAASALLAGLAAGIAALVLSLAALNFWFYPPFNAFGFAAQADLVRQLVFASSALLVAVLSAWALALLRRATARAAEAESARAHAERRAAEAEAIARGERASAGTFLVVDDDAETRRLATRTVEECGYAWLSACDGGEALELIERYEPTLGLVITDAVLPDMSGRELVEHIATRRSGVPVLYISSLWYEGLLQRGLLDARDAFLPKPLTSPELAKRLQEVRRRTTPERASAGR